MGEQITWNNPTNIMIYQFLTACRYYKDTDCGRALLTPNGKYTFVDKNEIDKIYVYNPKGRKIGETIMSDPDGRTIRTNRLIEIVMEHEYLCGITNI